MRWLRELSRWAGVGWIRARLVVSGGWDGGVLRLDDRIKRKGLSHWVWNEILEDRWCCRIGFEMNFEEFGMIYEIVIVIVL